MGERRYSSAILDLGTRWRYVVSFTPWPLYPRYHFRGGRVGPRGGLDAMGTRKKSPAPIGNRTLIGGLARSLVAIPTDVHMCRTGNMYVYMVVWVGIS
jgi:hypothetical protein